MKKGLIVVSLAFLNMAMTFSQDWQTDISTARAIAGAEEKPIILVFQGSDWCAPCIKLNQEVWTTSDFKEYADDHYVMLLADFPRKKKNALSEEQTEANAALAEKYNRSGIFPLVVVMDSEGTVLGETGYKKTTPQEYIDELNAFLD